MRFLAVFALSLLLASAAPAGAEMEHDVDEELRICVSYGGNEIIVVVPVPVQIADDMETSVCRKVKS